MKNFDNYFKSKQFPREKTFDDIKGLKLHEKKGGSNLL